MTLQKFSNSNSFKNQEISNMNKRLLLSALVSTIAIVASPSFAAEYLELTGEKKGRSYSAAVVTKGGRTVYLAGEGATKDENGKSLVGDFEGQVRATFAEMEKTLKRAGGKMSDIVSMTVYYTDARHLGKFTKIRSEIFPNNRPASAQITVSALAVPEMMVEIQAIAVIGDEK
jgi:enamine deaminase RidA (YjgF/YER057c/UK114 family)